MDGDDDSSKSGAGGIADGCPGWADQLYRWGEESRLDLRGDRVSCVEMYRERMVAANVRVEASAIFKGEAALHCRVARGSELAPERRGRHNQNEGRRDHGEDATARVATKRPGYAPGLFKKRRIEDGWRVMPGGQGIGGVG